ncbi:hypothetical protein [Kitasatospora cheerisanensis]|uniref:Uncharacterized protein n=1 Tax=Kitasatospora cheerisanensis KCTC 2395 TaxID=1348663 RepID=A0A066Z1Z6_9ACTN|nr:hypothetical protein [Kitasatospora cheerisanensis]KDN87537.1 hypothetical protein KCH_07090 [Kitasatospora cheerisanensis KCTC 2395]
MRRRPDRIAAPWDGRTPHGPGQSWPVRRDSRPADVLTERDVQRWAPAASLPHSNGDARDVAVRDGRMVGARGGDGDRANRGRPGPECLYGRHANAPTTTASAPVDPGAVPATTGGPDAYAEQRTEPGAADAGTTEEDSP